MRRTLAWSAVAALVVLGSRTIVYALSPSPLAAELSHRAGGPGLHCLAGPVHRNALPVLGARSLIAAAVAAALEHVFAWMRRTFARIAAPARGTGLVRVSRPAFVGLAPAAAPLGPLGARGP